MRRQRLPILLSHQTLTAAHSSIFITTVSIVCIFITTVSIVCTLRGFLIYFHIIIYPPLTVRGPLNHKLHQGTRLKAKCAQMKSIWLSEVHWL